MDQIIVVSENGKYKEHTTVQLNNTLILGFDSDDNVVALLGPMLLSNVKNNEYYRARILVLLEKWHHTIKPRGFKIPPELEDIMQKGILPDDLKLDDKESESETKVENASTPKKVDAGMKPCTLGDTEHRSPYEATVAGMLSPDYKERFKAEYQQTKLRYEKLKAFCNRIEAAMRTCPGDTKRVQMPEHDCPFDLLRDQQRAMGEYLHCLEIRAVIEGIELT